MNQTSIPFVGNVDFSQRTTWVGFGGVATGIFLIVTGHVQEGIMSILGGAAAITTRSAISALQDQVTPPKP